MTSSNSTTVLLLLLVLITATIIPSSHNEDVGENLHGTDAHSNLKEVEKGIEIDDSTAKANVHVGVQLAVENVTDPVADGKMAEAEVETTMDVQNETDFSTHTVAELNADHVGTSNSKEEHNVEEDNKKVAEQEAATHPKLESSIPVENLSGENMNVELQTKSQSVAEEANRYPSPINEFGSVEEKSMKKTSKLKDESKFITKTEVLEVEMVNGYDDDCSLSRGPLTILGSKSKFFVENTNVYNFREAREQCSKFDLVIAEVEGLADHKTLESYASLSHTGSKFFIGLNDIKIEGLFRHADGSNVTFQNFLASQPDDQDMREDCVVIMKESKHGPAGAADYDCNKTANVFCMFDRTSQCYNESFETKENRKLEKIRGVHLVVNATTRAYYVSNFQATWKNAMLYCAGKLKKLFNMDNEIIMASFRKILKREKEFIPMPISTVQYWTSGKFLKSHMAAPIIWHVKPDLTESEERGVEKHNATYSFSGLFNWSSKKQRDAGGPHGLRRDLCVSFGFDIKPYETPFLRNTNCDLPNYFICYEEYPEVEEDESPDIIMPAPVKLNSTVHARPIG